MELFYSSPLLGCFVFFFCVLQIYSQIEGEVVVEVDSPSLSRRCCITRLVLAAIVILLVSAPFPHKED